MSAVEILPGGGRRIEVVLYIGGDLVGTTATSDPGERALLMQYLKGNPGDSDPVPGPAGPTGPAGAAGADSTVPGPSEEDGAPGTNGTDGAPGAGGPQGPAGADGADGAPGAAGAPGVDGADSVVPGPEGPQGPAGEDGADGAPGAHGDDGPQGVQGLPGADGAPGTPGTPGADGEDGAPGPGVPAGGTMGQHLRKASSADYDGAWVSFSAKLVSFDGLTMSAGQSLYFTDANTAAGYATTLAGRNLSNVAGTINMMYYLSATDTWTGITTTTGGRAYLATPGTINTLPYFSAAGVLSLITTSANSRAVMGAATYTAMLTLLGIGTTAVEQRSLPSAATAANYVFVATDAGRTKLKAAADTTARTWTLNNTVFTAGDFVSGVNNASAGDVTLTPGTGVTLKTLGTGVTAASGYTVPPGCTFTVWMETAAIGWVSGIGITAL